MIKNILFDFDGVILNSMPIRDFGFREIFKKYNSEDVEKLIEYHTTNGGLSRFVKIKYFYEQILQKPISDERILEYAEQFSKIMKKELPNKKYLIEETVDFISQNYKKFNFHIVSGSEEKELNFLNKELNLNQFFITIRGSPTPKNELVKDIIKNYDYKLNETILIGDSINDYEAAKVNGIDFYGFNNEELKSISKKYITNYFIF